MREIKFRAWDKQFKKMVGLNGVQDLFSVRSDGMPSNANYDLMQYTGLKDKNGKEIYEGDIVNLVSGSIGQIIYNIHKTGFTLTPNKTNQRSEVVLGNLHTGMEVIGNIYENPELLEGCHN